ncbi:MAG: hypothetical protein ACLSHC_14135 [Bilophila wadsworthia]
MPPIQTPSLWPNASKAACSIWWATRWRPSPRRGCAPARRSPGRDRLHARRPHLRRAGQRHGADAEAAERLRDGLFTTKDGTGFGLLGTRKALLEMGGRLLWENLPDSGALFRIVLPLRVERTPAAAEANHLREDS